MKSSKINSSAVGAKPSPDLVDRLFNETAKTSSLISTTRIGVGFFIRSSRGGRR